MTFLQKIVIIIHILFHWSLYMETKDCKDFIESISEKYLLTTGNKWKRKRKYKQDFLVLRDFINEYGDKITISESEDENLGVFSLELVTKELSQNAINCLTRKKLFEGISKYIEENHSTEIDLSAISGIETIFQNHSHSLISEIKLTVIHEMISEFIDTDIDFDLENVDLTIIEKDDICCLLLEAGGDWEEPISAYFYWSEPTQSLKGFFPLGEGNTYNLATNTAYGSEDVYDDDELQKRYEDEIDNLNYDTAGDIGFIQLKKHIERDYDKV